MKNTALFRPQTIHDPGRGRRVVQVITCHGCGAAHEFSVNTRSRGGMADDTILRKARLLGWEDRRQGKDMTCPACVRGAKGLIVVRKLRTEPEAMAAIIGGDTPEEQTLRRDAIRLEAVLDMGAPSLAEFEALIERNGGAEAIDASPLPTLPETEPMPSTPAVAAPRQPSREDKRRINARLDDVYDGEETGYSGDWTDAKLAASLSVPEAWVRDIRIDFHGENAGNAAGDAEAKARRREINELRQDIKGIETRMMTALADAEKALAPLKARLDRLDPDGKLAVAA